MLLRLRLAWYINVTAKQALTELRPAIAREKKVKIRMISQSLILYSKDIVNRESLSINPRQLKYQLVLVNVFKSIGSKVRRS